MAETWGSPQKKKILAIVPEMKDGKQETDKYVSSALKFKARLEGESSPAYFYALDGAKAPVVGDDVEVVKCTSTAPNGTVYTSWWTTEAKAQKGGGKGGFGGAKPVYTLEQWAYAEAQRTAAILLCSGMLEGKNGIVMEPSLSTIRLVAPALAKDIIDAKGGAQ